MIGVTGASPETPISEEESPILTSSLGFEVTLISAANAGRHCNQAVVASMQLAEHFTLSLNLCSDDVLPKSLTFQHVHAQQPPRLRAGTENTPIRRQLPHSTRVHLQQPVNTSIFAAIGCTALIPHTFPPGNLRFLHSSHLGVTCQTQPAAIGSALFRTSAHAATDTARSGLW